MSADIPPCQCPVCGYHVDSAADIEGDSQPSPGDVSICFKCGEILVFNPDLTQSQAPLDSLLKLSPKQRDLLTKAQKMIRRERYVE